MWCAMVGDIMYLLWCCCLRLGDGQGVTCHMLLVACCATWPSCHSWCYILDMFCAISALCIVVSVGITGISWTTVPSMSWCESAARITANMSKSFSFILWHHFWWHSSEAMSAPDVPDPRGTLAAAQSLRSSLRERFSTNLSNLNIKNTCSLVISGCSPDLSADECLWWIWSCVFSVWDVVLLGYSMWMLTWHFQYYIFCPYVTLSWSKVGAVWKVLQGWH